jgi:hypothetical protein
MKRSFRIVQIAAAVAWLAVVVLPCAASNSPQEKMSQQDKTKKCNDAATQKGLTGADRKAFMQSCLSAGSDAATATTTDSKMSKQDKTKKCNDAATQKGLTGADRKTFMQSCLSAGSTPQ